MGGVWVRRGVGRADGVLRRRSQLACEAVALQFLFRNKMSSL